VTAHAVTERRVFDLDDLGAEVTEDLAAQWARKNR
jgi:hypothetical protein